MMPVYVTFPRIQFQRANALATGWLVSPCPAMAAVMMCEAFGHQLGEKPSGVALIHHDAQLLAESEMTQKSTDRGARFLHQFKGATAFNMNDVNSKYKNKQPVISLQPTASMNGTWSLILRYENPDIECDLAEAAKRFLSSARLAGGQIIDHGNPVVGKTLIGREGDRENWGVFDRSIASGFAIVDRSHLIGSNNQSKIGSLLALAAGDKQASDNDAGQMPQRKWYAPAVLGYAMLTDFDDQRKQARENKPHAYCEPMVGLVEYVSIRQLGEHGLDLKDLFWSHQWLDESIFAITH